MLTGVQKILDYHIANYYLIEGYEKMRAYFGVQQFKPEERGSNG